MSEQTKSQGAGDPNTTQSGISGGAGVGQQRVPSTSDDRVKNNVMRHEYRVLTDNEKKAMQEIKDMGLMFHEHITMLGNSREVSVAKTKVEEAVMWAVKHITA